MGRAKRQMKRIEKKINRQVTFSKRRNGLIKKAFELSVLCDIDVALLMFSPSGRLTQFSGHRRIEDIISRYLYLPKAQRGSPGDANKNDEEIILQEYISKCHQQLEMYEECLRYLNVGSGSPTSACTSLTDLQPCENYFMNSLARVTDTKVQVQLQKGEMSKTVQDFGDKLIGSTSPKYQIQSPSKINSNQDHQIVHTSDSIIPIRNEAMINSCTTQIDRQAGDDKWPAYHSIDYMFRKGSMSENMCQQDYLSEVIWQQKLDDLRLLSSQIQLTLCSQQIEISNAFRNEQVQLLSEINYNQDHPMVQTSDPLMPIRNEEILNPCTTQIDRQAEDEKWSAYHPIDDMFPQACMSKNTCQQDCLLEVIWQQKFNDFLSSLDCLTPCSQQIEMSNAFGNEQVQPVSEINFNQGHPMVQTSDPLMSIRNEEILNSCTTQINRQAGDEKWLADHSINDMFSNACMSENVCQQDYLSEVIWQQKLEDFLSSPIPLTSCSQQIEISNAFDNEQVQPLSEINSNQDHSIVQTSDPLMPIRIEEIPNPRTAQIDRQAGDDKCLIYPR